MSDNTRNQIIRCATVLAVIVVSVIAAIQSYSHMHDLAYTAGEQWRAHLFPVSVDGLVVAASMVLLSQQIMILTGRQIWLGHRIFAATALAMGVIVSLAANIADAWDKGPLARAIAGWPALAFATVFHLLLIQWKTVSSQVEPVATVVEIPVQEPVAIPHSASSEAVATSLASLSPVPPVANEQPVANPVATKLANDGRGQVASQPVVKRSAASTAEEVAKLVTNGMADDEIATKLKVSERTVRRYRTSATNGHAVSA